MPHRDRGSVLALVAAGYTNEATAERLCVSANTVKTHVAHIFRKLGVHSRLDAGRIYRALTVLLPEIEEVLSSEECQLADAADRDDLEAEFDHVLDRLGVSKVDEARRLYQVVMNRAA